MSDLKKVYKALTKQTKEKALLELKAKWGEKYPITVKSWTDNWDELSTYFQYTEPIRRITNTIERFNRQIRKITKTKGSLPNDGTVIYLLFAKSRLLPKLKSQ